jgi:OOP family OmpA-OmpF porin
VNNIKKIALAAAVLCTTGTVFAQDQAADVINPSWYIAPTVVRIKPDHRFLVADYDWGGGLKFGKPVNRWFDIQVGAITAKSERSDVAGNWSYRNTMVGIDGLLFLSRKTIRPFLLAGIGAQRDIEKNPIRGNVSDWSPYANAGVGVQVAFNDQWSAQADVRAVRAHLSDESRFGFNRALNKYASLSINYAFNPPPRPAPAPAPAPVAEAPAPAPAPVAPPPPPAPRFEKVSLSSTELFGFDSATLNLPQPKLDEIAAALQADTSITDVDITGYTDRLGSPKYNQKLSERRANAVRQYLVGKGVDGSRLKAYGKGEQNPVVTDCHQKKRAELIACLAPNRRVEVEQITVERRVQ